MSSNKKIKKKKGVVPRIAVFASGNGSNFEALAKTIPAKKIKAKIAFLLTDNPRAYALKRASRLNMPAICVNPKNFSCAEEMDRHISAIIKKNKINWIFLAGYMRILSRSFVKQYRNRIINIHPSLLPAFKGKNAIKRAFAYGCKVTGVTVHFVDEKIDSGPVLAQEPLAIKEGMSLKALEWAVHKLEHKLYPKALRIITEGKIKTNGRRVTANIYAKADI